MLFKKKHVSLNNALARLAISVANLGQTMATLQIPAPSNNRQGGCLVCVRSSECLVFTRSHLAMERFRVPWRSDPKQNG